MLCTQLEWQYAELQSCVLCLYLRCWSSNQIKSKIKKQQKKPCSVLHIDVLVYDAIGILMQQFAELILKCSMFNFCLEKVFSFRGSVIFLCNNYNAAKECPVCAVLLTAVTLDSGVLHIL